MPEGYGAFKSSIEIDAVQAKMQIVSEVHKSIVGPSAERALQAEQDVKKMKQREDEMDSMAKRVINKFNNNSERILNIMTKQQPAAKQASNVQDFIFDSMDRDDRRKFEAQINLQTDPEKLKNNPDGLYKSDQVIVA